MAPEGMVHALTKAHSLLRGNGRLVDIHPHPDEPEIIVRVGTDRHLAGWLHETDDRVEYEQADAALETVVAQGRFALVRRETFVYNIYAPGISELQTYLEENWQDAIVDDRVVMRANELLNTPELDIEVILREFVRIGLYDRRDVAHRPVEK